MQHWRIIMKDQALLNQAEAVLGCVHDEEVIRFTQDFIRINSVNPNLDKAPGEEEAASFLARACAQNGFEGRTYEVLPGRHNFFGLLPGKSEEIGLAFFGHMD